MVKGLSKGGEIERGKAWVWLSPELFRHNAVGGIFRAGLEGGKGREGGGGGRGWSREGWKRRCVCGKYFLVGDWVSGDGGVFCGDSGILIHDSL